MTSDILYVSQTPSAPLNDVENVVIEKELRSLREERVEEVINSLLKINITSDFCPPLYDIIKFRLTDPAYTQCLVPSILTYEILDGYIQDYEPSKIKCGELDGRYLVAVQDIAAAYDIELTGVTWNPESRLKSYLIGLYEVSGALRALTRSSLHQAHQPTKQINAILFPEPRRPESFSPILNEYAESNSDVRVFLRDGEASLDAGEGDNFNKINQAFDPQPLASISTAPDLYEVIRFLTLELPRDIFVNDSFETQLRCGVETQEGYDLKRSVARVVTELLPNMIHAGVSHILARNLFRQYECEQVIVGRVAEPERAVLLAAQKQGVETFHLPHSVVTGYPAVGPGSVTRFVPGSTGQQRLDELSYVPDDHQTVMTGRPRLGLIQERQREGGDRGEESWPIRVLIATQPWNDTVRREFVQKTVEALHSAAPDLEPIIKPHPGEDPEFYRSVVDDLSPSVDILPNEPVDVVTEFDLLVTIDSNIGLESIASGTPSVSVNLWSPLIRESPYLREGPIPVLYSPEEMTEFFDRSDAESLEELYQEERNYVRENFALDSDSVARITRTLAERRERDARHSQSTTAE